MSNAERLNQNVLNVISVCQRILVVAKLEKTYAPVDFYFVQGAQGAGSRIILGRQGAWYTVWARSKVMIA